MATKKDLVEAHAFSKRRLDHRLRQRRARWPRGRAGPAGARPDRRHRALGAAARRRRDRGLPHRSPQLGVARAGQLRHLQGDRRAVRRPARRRRPAAPARAQLPLRPAPPRRAGADRQPGLRHVHPRGRPRVRPRHRRCPDAARGRGPDRRRLDGVHRGRHRHQAHPHRGPGHRRAAPVGLPGQQRGGAVARRPEPRGQRPPAPAPRGPDRRRRDRRPPRLRRDLAGPGRAGGVAQPLPAGTAAGGGRPSGSPASGRPPTTRVPRPTCPRSGSATSCARRAAPTSSAPTVPSR